MRNPIVESRRCRVLRLSASAEQRCGQSRGASRCSPGFSSTREPIAGDHQLAGKQSELPVRLSAVGRTRSVRRRQSATRAAEWDVLDGPAGADLMIIIIGSRPELAGKGDGRLFWSPGFGRNCNRLSAAIGFGCER